jgi:lysophospholipase L1-like esterase
MHSKIKEYLYMLITVVLLLVFAEGVMRMLSFFSPIYDLEMIDYAQKLKRSSDIPGLSHEHIPNSSARLMGHEVILNSMGHRSPELSKSKHDSEKRVHFIGSSMIMGWGVPQESTIPMLTAQSLEKSVPNIKNGYSYVAANAGVGNYNAVYSVKKFAQQVEQVKPDLVIFQYYINDAEPDPTGRDNTLFKYSYLAAFSYLRFRSIWAVRSETLDQYYNNLYRPDSPTLIQTKKALQQAKTICKQRNIPLIALLIPEMHDLSENSPYIPIYKTIESLFTDLEIPLVNPLYELRESFGDRPNRAWVALDDPHPSAEAHKIIADKLVGFLGKEMF